MFNLERDILIFYRAIVCLILALVLARPATCQPAGTDPATKYPPGLIVTSVTKGSPAEQAGLKPGDVFISLDGIPLRFDSQIAPIRDRARMSGRKTVLLVVHTEKQDRSLTVSLGPHQDFVYRPPLPSAAQRLCDEALALPKERAATAIAQMRAAAESAAQSGDDRAASRLWWATYRRASGGSPDQAEALSSALASAERAGDRLLAADIFNVLGNASSTRGRLDEAEAYQKRALAIRELLAPDSLDLATSLNNLGSVYFGRGRLDEAESYLKRAVAISEMLAPDSLDLASSLNNLGIVARIRGRLDEAETYYKRALAIKERLAPDSLDLASSLNNLGIVARIRGRVDEAEAYFKRALAIKERLAPDSLDLAGSLNNLGNVAYGRGRPDDAEAYYKRALAIQEKLAPESLAVATSLNNLATVASDRGRLAEAEAQLQAAWQVVRRQAAFIAGDAARQEFGTATAWYAANLVAAQVALGKPDAALTTLEEGRAQALAQSLADRSVTERVTPAKEWSAYQAALQRHNAGFKEAERAAESIGKAKALLAALREEAADVETLKDKQRALDAAEQAYEPKRLAEASARESLEGAWSDVRKASSAAAPAAVSPEAARKQLPSGTLLLEFSAAKSRATLFVVSTEGVRAFVLPAKRDELEKKVAFVRRIVARDTDDRAKNVTGGDIEQDALRTLFKKLFPPEARAAIQRAKQIVISPDDFLWDLPFAALITNETGAPVYLGLEKPLSYTQSLTLLFAPATANPAPGTGALIVGNPVYDEKRRADVIAAANRAPKPQSAALKPPSRPGANVASLRRRGELGTMTRGGEAPQQLPNAEKEAKQIAGLYHTSAHTGVEPTEAWFRQHAGQAKILHLATHGFLNPYSAQSSGVLLAVPDKSPPEGEYENDGTLQAWEMWTMKLKADLVVLSACETGRGGRVDGEGLIGLTRSLQYAGAKSIVASQWKVSDESTAALMTEFHAKLLAGVERDEALRLAMAKVAGEKSGRWSEPYHWAPFLLVGETGRIP
ncbi:MAG TPA: CHAT domain-containing protein [Chthonomonadaceae bacterium]|nr:CHAT domain-containing protein [Chthonomonadaceae bacterium]